MFGLLNGCWYFMRYGISDLLEMGVTCENIRLVWGGVYTIWKKEQSRLKWT